MLNVQPARSQPITNLETLRVLADTQRHRILTLLAERSHSARSLAQRLKMPRTRMYYHLDLLERHGLITEAGFDDAHGSPERYYRATARQYRIDRRLLKLEATEAQILDVQAEILEKTADDLRASGTVEPLVTRGFLQLSNERRSELKQRLIDLLDEYRNTDQGAKTSEYAIALFDAR
jgi:DNA-binding transcriptional ArsR family regulator